MTPILAKATFLGICGLLLAGTASGKVPDPPHSSIPRVIYLVGRNGCGMDSYGTFIVTIRGFTTAPMPKPDVSLDFTCRVGIVTGAARGLGPAAAAAL